MNERPLLSQKIEPKIHVLAYIISFKVLTDFETFRSDPSDLMDDVSLSLKPPTVALCLRSFFSDSVDDERRFWASTETLPARLGRTGLVVPDRVGMAS